MEEDITTDLTILQSRLETMINKVEGDNLMLKKLRSFQIQLLELTTLPEVIGFVLEQLKTIFDLDDISLSLINQDDKIKNYLDNYDYPSNQGLILLDDDLVLVNELSSGACIGDYNAEKHEVFFPLRGRLPETIAIMPLKLNSQYIGSLNLSSKKTDGFFNNFVNESMAQLTALISIALENGVNFEIIKQVKLSESLAHLNNRNFLEQRLVEELDRSRRRINCVSCLVLDVIFSKGRKKTNQQKLEQYVLDSVSSLLKKQLRINDVFSYYEGKKFAVLLMNVSDETVLIVAERLQNALKNYKMTFLGQAISASISIGYANYSLSPEESLSHQDLALQLIGEADVNLNEKKIPTSK